MRAHTRGDHVINWIETYCRFPSGPDRGKPVRLSQAEVLAVRQIYDSPDGPNQTAPLTGRLAAFLALASVCSHEALRREFVPEIDTDIFSVWNAAGLDLKAVLRRDGGRIVCPELGTKFPAAA